jgi:S-adenosylmethionine hydrolase
MAPVIVTLTTDFGLSDPYVGQMKAVLLAMAPDVRIIDLSHDIAPQAVTEAAFVLETSWRFFPEGTIHVVVVDPGVGMARRRLAIAARGHYFAGPDNGCLSVALPDEVRGLRRAEEGYEARPIRVPEAVSAISIDKLDLLPRPPSATFEGRDVFAPVVALLASGTAIEGLGAGVSELLAFPSFRAPSFGGGLDGSVMRVDRFGNLITDIHGDDLPPDAAVRIGGLELRLARTYGESEGLAVIIGSSGYLEVALPNGSAAASLAAGPGTPVLALPR